MPPTPTLSATPLVHTPAFTPVPITENVSLVASWGSKGESDGQFQRAKGIAVDGAGNLFVADQGNNRVQVFNAMGKFLAKWGLERWSPRYVVLDGSGNIYVTDALNHRVVLRCISH